MGEMAAVEGTSLRVQILIYGRSIHLNLNATSPQDMENTAVKTEALGHKGRTFLSMFL